MDPSGRAVSPRHAVRFVGVFLFVAVVMLGGAHDAGAAVAGRVAGPARGTVVEWPVGCGDIAKNFTGTITTAPGPASLVVHTCYAQETPGNELTGTFAIKVGAGSVFGSATGTECPGHRPVNFDVTLRIKRSTPGFPAPGTLIDFRGTERFDGKVTRWLGRVVGVQRPHGISC